MYEVRMSSGGWRTLTPTEEAAWRAEDAYRAMRDGAPKGGELYQAWRVADEVLYSMAGHEGYQAAVAWADMYYSSVRPCPRETVGERVSRANRASRGLTEVEKRQ